eukprot:Nk52_evm29s236 gene=Nk52_evmTU29s236
MSRFITGAAKVGLTFAAAVFGGNEVMKILPEAQSKAHLPQPKPFKVPSREEQLKNLKKGQEYDVLIIGGGATGCGIAVDSITRGLSTAMVERDDFASGTSSRSTKLIHGGVRYLEKAFWNLDYGQYQLVQEALHERATLLKIAPHVCHPLPIMLPVYTYWQIPYFYAGAKVYDLIAGSQGLKPAYFLSKDRAIEKFPMLKKEKLKGAIVYYDGQQDDARMCLSLALSAAKEGAHVANHVEVVKLLKEKDPKTGEDCIVGATMRDVFTKDSWDVRAKVVINATGPFTDFVRVLDNPSDPEMVKPSSGVHVTLPSYYSPKDMGLLDPATSDGRVIFFLPWLNKTIAGTTDSPTTVTAKPKAREEEIRFILGEIESYLNPDVHVRRGDVLAAWSGIRPLVSDPNSTNTEAISRNHVVFTSKSKLVTIAGGKWTTYRAMAEHALDEAIRVGGLKPKRGCQTNDYLLVGAEGWTPTMFIRLIQDFGLENPVARNLSESYGTQAFEVAKYAAITNKRWPVVGKRLVDEYPYIEAEVIFSIKEYACTAIDFLARRSRLAFLNAQAASEALPRVLDIMAKELNWSKARKEQERKDAMAFLETMGLSAPNEPKTYSVNLTKAEVALYAKEFKSFDTNNDGHIKAAELRVALRNMGEEVTDEQLHDLIEAIDLNRNGAIELDEYLQLMSALKTGELANTPIATIYNKHLRKHLDVDRSGGGF